MERTARFWKHFCQRIRSLVHERGLPMRNAIALFASSVLVVVAAALPGHPGPLPQTHLSVTDIYSHPFEVDLPYDQKVTLDLRSGEYRVAPSTGEKFSVRTTGDRAEKG